jgi:hypothetical protein
VVKTVLRGSLSLLVQDIQCATSPVVKHLCVKFATPSCSAEVNEWICTCTPSCAFMVCTGISLNYFTLLLLYSITYFVVIQGTLLFQELSLPKGAILHLKGTNSDTTRDIIKKTLVQEGLDVIFVQFCNGGSEAWVRLQGENSSKEVRDIGNCNAVCVIFMELFTIYYA